MTTFRRKACRSCHVEKVISKCNFYRDARSADGFLHICIPCKRNDIEENRALKRDYYRAQDRIRNARPDRVAARQTYAHTQAGRAARQRAHRRWKAFKALESRA